MAGRAARGGPLFLVGVLIFVKFALLRDSAQNASVLQAASSAAALFFDACARACQACACPLVRT